MDNNNQQNLNTSSQPPSNPILPTSKNLNKKVITIIAFVIIALVTTAVGFLIFKNPTSVSTNTSNNNVPLPSVNTGYDKTSLSWAYVYGPENGRVKVYLNAPDQSSAINQNPWGFAFEGDTIISGHYKLIMDPSTEEDGLGGGWSSAQVDLGGLQFNPKRPLTDGKLHTLQLDQNGYQDSLAFYQYGSSNTDVMYIYRYISDKFSQIHFVAKNGKAENFTETGLGGELQSNSDGTFTSEWYDNTKGYVTTKWKYSYTDNNFHEIETVVSTNSSQTTDVMLTGIIQAVKNSQPIDGDLRVEIKNIWIVIGGGKMATNNQGRTIGFDLNNVQANVGKKAEVFAKKSGYDQSLTILGDGKYYINIIKN